MTSIGAKDFLQRANEPSARPEKKGAVKATEGKTPLASSLLGDSKETKTKSFADDLEMHRNLERKERPGREDNAQSMAREGKPKDERETDSARSPNPVAGKKTDVKRVAQSAKKLKESPAGSASQRASQKPTDLSAAGLSQSSSRANKIEIQPEGEDAEVESQAIGSAAGLIGKHPKAEKLGAGSQPLVKIDEDLDDDDLDLSQLDKLDVLDEMQAEQVRVRQESMQGFLDKMQNEFGIAPEKVVEAFTKMDPQTLMGAPEASTAKFMSNLQVAPNDQARVQELYQNMVETTSHAATSQKLIAMQAGDVEQLPGNPPKTTTEALEKLAEAMDEIDKAFGQPMDILAQNVPLDPKMKSQMAAETMNARLMQMAQQQKPAAKADEKIAPIVVGGAAAIESQDTSIDEIIGSEAPVAPQTQSAPSATGSTLANLAGGQAGGGSAFGNGDGGQSKNGGSGSQNAKAAFQATTATGAAKKADAKTEAKIAPKDGSAQLANAQGADESAMQATPKAAAAGTVAAGLQGKAAAPSDDEANVRELMKQAQVVLKKGGGEIKMDLKPEGAGQVHLKVSVIDGQVNVQMLTENEATKKLLEKGLHELKAGLASHDLKLESMKVATTEAANKNMDMDKQNDDQARQQARQFANDVMGQFRDERQAFQQGMMENPGWRQYGRPQTRANMSPEAVGATTRAASQARSGGSSRLNLVA